MVADQLYFECKHFGEDCDGSTAFLRRTLGHWAVYWLSASNEEGEAEGWHVMHTDKNPWFSFGQTFTAFSAIKSQNNSEST